MYLKGLIVALLLVIGICLITSCKKEPITPGNYEAGTQIHDTTNWPPYSNNGTVPTWTNNPTTNPVNGTNWVLIDVYNNYAHISKSDTIHFISNNKYSVGSDTTKYLYNLYSTMGNATIELNTFMPINGLNLSANNFNANAFTSVPIGGTIQLTLKDILNPSNRYISTFKKI